MDVSIIVPIYNVAPYLMRCLESVAHQDYQGSLECILVDDCGQDESMEIAERFVANYEGPISFNVVRDDRNRGLSAARNTGTRNASGDWVYYLDSDDEISPDCISLLMYRTKQHKDVELVQGYIKCFYTDFFRLDAFDGIDFVDDNCWIKRHYYKVDKPRLNVNAWNKLVNRSFLVDNKIYFKEGIIHEDILWMFHICQVLNKIAFVHKETYIHYKCENSIIEKSNKDNTIRLMSMGIILSEIVRNIGSPLITQQIYYYYLMCLSLGEKLPGSKGILYRFLLLSIRHKMYLSSSLLFCYLFVPKKRGAKFFQRKVERVNAIRDVLLKRLL